MPLFESRIPLFTKNILVWFLLLQLFVAQYSPGRCRVELYHMDTNTIPVMAQCDKFRFQSCTVFTFSLPAIHQASVKRKRRYSVGKTDLWAERYNRLQYDSQVHRFSMWIEWNVDRSTFEQYDVL